MASDIESYLRELQAALAGGDPALVQDALFDAEEHLREQLAAVEAREGNAPAGAQGRFAEVVESYGTPEEVAAAYLAEPGAGAGAGAAAAAWATGPGSAERTAVRLREGTPAPPAPLPPAARPSTLMPSPPSGPRHGPWRRFFGIVADARAWKALVYMLLSLATGIAYFTIVVTGVSTAAGLIILVIGLPFLLLVLGIVRGMSLFEGRLVEVLLGTRMPRRPRATPPNATLIQRMWFWLKDGRTWLAMVYMILQLPLGIAYFTIAVTGLAVGAWGIVLPFLQLATGHTYINYGSGLNEFLFPGWAMPFVVIAGALVFVIALHVIRGIGRLHASYAKRMLVRLAK